MQQVIARQRDYFASGATRDVAFRVARLHQLKDAIKASEAELFAALKADLNKSEFESYTSEIAFCYEEINHAVRHVDGWARPRRVSTPLVHQPSSSRVIPQPKGLALIIGPWNYPFQLLISPLVGSIAAGNCTVMKASEIAPATADAITKMIRGAFGDEYIAVIEGGVPETTALLKEHFDHIFFTGSIPVGRIVMHAAAENLTPVTLELGGKSPCFIDRDIDIQVTARRVVWGKFYNAGQTCVAPDYLLVHNAVKKPLLEAMKVCVKDFFGDDPKLSPDYGRIVSDRHFDRLSAFLTGDVAVGGQADRATRYIAPTILDNAKMSDKVMEEEIFGPVLPVLGYDDLGEAIKLSKQRPNPLACYVFTNDTRVEERVINELPFGGGCVNNALIHLANPNMPFGGVGQSGMGGYHGKDTFDLFSHKKSMMKTPMSIDIRLKYPPYNNRLSLMRMLMR